MPVRSVKNQYLGVNAHLHSFWQGAGKWNRFHNIHIGDLAHALMLQLRPMGYVAQVEESLQIRRIGDTSLHPRADILIADVESKRRISPAPRRNGGAQTIALQELIEYEEDQEHPYSAIGLYGRSSNTLPVAWIELLSPSNKGGSIDAQMYRAKRTDLIHDGMVFVELDYLHETPPTFWRLADYTRQEPGAHPYRIVVLEPRPTFRQGYANLYEFDVDAALPKVTIPLNAADVVDFEFGAPYNATFERMFYGDDLDYAELPLNFDRYSEADQTHIARRMVAVLEAARAGLDLESAPFPVKELPLLEALAQIDSLKQQLL